MRALGLCFALVIATVSPVSAQRPSPIGRGSWIIAGSASLSSTHYDGGGGNSTTLQLSPTALFFVIPRLAIGGTFPFGYTKAATGHSSTYGLGPSARIYFGDLTGQWLPFVSASAQQEWLKLRFEGGALGGLSDRKDTSLDASVGLTGLLATNVGVTGEAYYTHMHFDEDVFAGTAKKYGLRFGLTVFLY